MLHICDDVNEKSTIDDVRKKLAKRTIVPHTRTCVETNDQSADKLPGGLWGVGASRDVSV